MTTLYRRLLGDKFDRLPPTLRDFHQVDRERHFHAKFKITRGKGFFKNVVAKLGGLPPAGENVPMRLRVVPDGEREHWHREFGKHKLSSIQWEQNGLLMEKLGPVTLAFRLETDSTTLYLHRVKAWGLNFLRLPLFLAPNGEGIETGQENGCAIIARASMPLLGQLVQYEGLVLPEES